MKWLRKSCLNNSPSLKCFLLWVFLSWVQAKILFFTFRFLPPSDPCGRNGPLLVNFLSKVPVCAEPVAPLCPYAKSKKCTYGVKCKFSHPERQKQHKSVTEKLDERTRGPRREARERAESRENSPGAYVYLILKCFLTQCFFYQSNACTMRD